MPKPFIPPNCIPRLRELPPELDYNLLIKEIGKAYQSLGRLIGLLVSVSNPGLLTAPLLTKEAVSSSAIEGTQATLEEALMYEAQGETKEETEKEKDIREIINYRKAINAGMEKLKEMPIGENFIKDLHYTLMGSVRGANKDRGNLRKTQVWIGPPGAPIESATFIPSPPSELPSLLSNWETYINSTEEKDPLVQIAVAHYQFEAIHPFLDGNGRVGRLLIPLFLYQREILPSPLLYVSGYLEKEREDYYYFLNNVSVSGDWHSWIRFFLVALEFQALDTQITICKMFNLYEQLKAEISSTSVHAIKLLDILFYSPIVSFPSIKKKLIGPSNQTIYNLLAEFEKKGIINEISGRRRPKLFALKSLLDILKETE